MFIFFLLFILNFNANFLDIDLNIRDDFKVLQKQKILHFKHFKYGVTCNLTNLMLGFNVIFINKFFIKQVKIINLMLCFNKKNFLLKGRCCVKIYKKLFFIFDFGILNKKFCFCIGLNYDNFVSIYKAWNLKEVKYNK